MAWLPDEHPLVKLDSLWLIYFCPSIMIIVSHLSQIKWVVDVERSRKSFCKGLNLLNIKKVVHIVRKYHLGARDCFVTQTQTYQSPHNNS